MLDCLHSDGGKREQSALPTLAYVRLSPTTQWDLDEVNREKILKILSAPSGERWRTIVQRTSGLSPLLARELEEERVVSVPRKQKAGKENKGVSLPVRRFLSSQGLEVFSGKHKLGNDYLLRHLARDNDLWFHSQDVPGSRVLLKVGWGGEAGLQSITEAVAIAAHYSPGEGSTRAPMDYTRVKDVHRPRRAKPGMVTHYIRKS